MNDTINVFPGGFFIISSACLSRQANNTLLLFATYFLAVCLFIDLC